MNLELCMLYPFTYPLAYPLSKGKIVMGTL